MHPRLVVPFSALVALLTCGCQNFNWCQARADFHETADVRGVRLVLIESRNGPVRVEADPAATEADVTGSKYASGATDAEAREHMEKIRIRVAREEGRPEVLRIVAEFPGLANGSPGASFRVVLPPEVELNISTSNGSVSVTGTRREVKAESSNGSITVEKIAGSALLKTTNASVTVRQADGDVDIVSSNGSLQLEQAGAGRVHAVTSNAQINAVDVRGDVTLVSSNGGVSLRTAAPPARLRIRTSNAGVRIHLPSNIHGTVRLATTNAGVHSSLSGAVVSESHTDRNSFSAVLNGGGPGLVEVETSNGSIHFDLEPAARQAEAMSLK